MLNAFYSATLTKHKGGGITVFGHGAYLPLLGLRVFCFSGHYFRTRGHCIDQVSTATCLPVLFVFTYLSIRSGWTNEEGVICSSWPTVKLTPDCVNTHNFSSLIAIKEIKSLESHRNCNPVRFLRVFVHITL